MKILISVNSFNFLVEPIESVIPFTINQNITNQLQNAFDDEDYVIIPDPVPAPLTISANPKSFYEKLIGVEGECSLFTIYQSILQTGLNPNTDSSSLNFAITVFNGALNNNDWTKPYAKPVYLEAYNILKMFLTQEQIEVIDQENINFNLV